jgi:hypothetical protein
LRAISRLSLGLETSEFVAISETEVPDSTTSAALADTFAMVFSAPLGGSNRSLSDT